MPNRESETMVLARERFAGLAGVADVDVALSALWLNMLGRRHAAWVQTTARSIEFDENEAAIVVALGLQEPGNVTSVGLKSMLMITSGGITRATDRLVRKGLVTRNEDPDDGRRVHLRLTTEGRRRFEQLLDLVVERHGERLARLAPARRAEVLAALDDLLALYDDIDVPR